MEYKTIGIYDTAVNSLNLGDLIILDAVKKELIKLFPEMTQTITIPTHERVSRRSIRISNKNLINFVSGTNLLNSKFKLVKANQWNLDLIDVYLLKKNIILMGVGWSNYQEKPTFLTKKVYKKLFLNELLHSVRDQYTMDKLKEVGIKNVINTGCPTTWNFTKEFCVRIPKHKSNAVVTTLTDYRKDIINDSFMLDKLTENYKIVYLWLQGAGDFDYYRSLNIKNKSNVKFISPSLEEYDSFLSENNCDYVGTRLHAGIRAMQHEKRTVIISVDNRATEMGKDLNLPVIERNNLKNELKNIIQSNFETKVNIPTENINIWKNEIRKISNGKL